MKLKPLCLLSWLILVVGPRGFSGAAVASGASALGIAPAIIPTPKSLKLTGGDLRIGASGRVVYEQAELAPLATILAGDIRRIHGVRLETCRATDAPTGGIRLRLVHGDSRVKGLDAHRVVVDSGAVVAGENYNAVAFGMMTVLQAMRKQGDGLLVPRMTVLDDADRAFRALQLDIKTGYHSPEWVKRAIDLARFYKVRLLELHSAESMWIGCTLDSSNAVPLDVRRRNLLWTRKEMDEVIAYAKARGVFLFPHNESTPRFVGMKKALTSDFNSADALAGYMDEIDGKGAYEVTGSIPDQADDRFWSFIKVVTQRSYDQFAAGWPGGVLPYYHMGPVYGEGGTSPANAVRILGCLKQKNPNIKLMFWCGPRASDPALAPHKDNIAVAFYSSHWGGRPQDLVKAGYEIVNVSWTPLYILPGTRHKARRQGKWIFDEFQLYRFGDEGTADSPSRRVNDCSQWANKVVGSMLPTWEFSNARHIEGHLEMILPCIPFYAEHAWNVRPYPYPKGAWEKVASASDRLAPLALQIVCEPRPPGPPSDVTATQGLHPGAVEVLWAAGDNHPESFRVYRAESDNPAKAQPISKEIPAAYVTKLNRFRDTTVKSGMHYFYWVRSDNPHGHSAFARSAEGWTGEGIATAEAYEPFDYDAGASIDKLSGGTGWQTPWLVKETNGSLTINPKGLRYPGLKTTGRSLRLHPTDADEKDRRRPPHVRILRTLARQFGHDGTRLWCGFLLRGEKVGIGDVAIQAGRTSVGKTWGNRLSVYTDRAGAMEAKRTYLVVVRYTYHKGHDLIHMWINPVPGTQPADEDADVITRRYDNPQDDTFGIRMQPYGLGVYDIDEIRLGKKYEHVAPATK